jgi:urea transport system substrate-binding protein
MFGLSCLACAELAAEEINADGGLLARELRLEPIDGAGAPSAVADRVVSAVAAGRVEVLAGWHLSHVRRAILSRLDDTPYLYSALYEGGERGRGLLLLGETPEQQLAPAVDWFRRERGVRRWAVVGDDYLWPRGSLRAFRRFAHDGHVEIVDEMLVPLGTRHYGRVLSRLRGSRAQAVLLLLVGQDAVHFNRAFAASAEVAGMLRFSPLMDENMLLASGASATDDLYAAAGYFNTLATPGALDLVGRYTRRFGPDAPVLNSMGESCYEAVRLLGVLARDAGSLDAQRLLAAGDGTVGYDGPRGAVHLRGRHLAQEVYLARADGVEFDVLTGLRMPGRA